MSDGAKSIWQRMKESQGLAMVLAIVGALGFPIGIFAWAGITPESVGTAAYKTIRALLPAIVGALAFLSGWNAKKLLMARQKITAKRIAYLEDERGRLREKIDCYESAPERARAKFTGLTFAQSDLVGLAHGERDGFVTRRTSKKFPAALERPDIFTVCDMEDGKVRVSLTKEWATLMNSYYDIYSEVWQKRRTEEWRPTYATFV